MAKQISKLTRPFRERFQFATTDSTHYFPGHMSRGLKQIQKQLKDIDCIIEVHDARILPKVVDLVTSGPRYNREGVEGFRLLVIGIPNVGKSSLINAMRRIHIRDGKKNKATRVGSEAGITRSVLTEIKICESPRITLIDSPGILQPKITDVEVGMRLALCSNMKDYMVGEEMIADYMLFTLNKQGLFKYVEFYNLSETTDDILELLFSVAKQRNLFREQKAIISGGHQIFPDFNQAAKFVLDDFRNGKLGRINLDREFTDKLSASKGIT